MIKIIFRCIYGDIKTYNKGFKLIRRVNAPLNLNRRYTASI